MARAHASFAVLLLVALALQVAAPCAAAKAPADADASEEAASEEAAREVAGQFIDLVKQLFGGAPAAAANADPKTVAELAQNAPGNVSLLVDGVERAGLHTNIADPNFQATIFAPTNWAFEVALVKLKISPKQLWGDKTALLNILSYHTIGGQALAAADLKDGQQLTTVSQHPLTVKVDRVAGTVIQGASDTAKVLAADIRAGKAIIHVIDTVLIPPVKPSL